jgi:hypothetical protein
MGISALEMVPLSCVLPAREASSATIRRIIDIIPRKLVPMFAMCFSAPHGKHGLSRRFNVRRSMLFLKDNLRRAPFVISPNQGIARDAQFNGPLGQREGFTIKGNELAVAPIVALFNFCSPPTIFRRIAPIVVNAVQRFSGLWKAHIVQKVFKYLPSVTKPYTATSVVFVTTRTRGSAAHFHAYPDGMGANSGKNLWFVHGRNYNATDGIVSKPKKWK